MIDNDKIYFVMIKFNSIKHKFAATEPGDGCCSLTRGCGLTSFSCTRRGISGNPVAGEG